MATLTIRKISDKVWKHSPSDGNSYIISKLYIKSDGDNIRVCEFNGAIRAEYNFADIVVYNIGGGAETFTSSQEVMERLEALNYVGFFSDGEVTPSDLISSDANNAIVEGTDNKLFVNNSAFLSSDETSYPDATLPLSGTEKVILNDGTGWKNISWNNIKAQLKIYFDTIYQTILVSGTNIKTINGNSILGSGNLTINTGSYTVIGKNVVNSSSVTGTTATTTVETFVIPANTFQAGDVILFRQRMIKTGVNSVVSSRSNIAGGLLTFFSQTSNNSHLYSQLEVTLIVKSATATQGLTSSVNAFSSNGGYSTVDNSNIDWTVNQNLAIALNNNSALDSTVVSYWELSRIR